MSPAAKSVYYFGFYLIATGITLVFIPNFFLKTVQLPETKEVWIRVVGLLVFCIGYYYYRAGAENVHALFRHTILMRIVVCAAFVVFVILKLVAPVLIVFGVIDLIGAAWTWSVLRKQRN
jgi:hypothetical protein